MRSTSICFLAPAAAVLVMLSVRPATAQTAAAKTAPTAADWSALAKLPDFTGVWEIGPGGGGRGRGAAPQGPSLTPAAAAKRKELQSLGREDNQTANCVPPGMPGIMGQPYPMEFLLTPGKVTIVIEAYTQVRHIYTDGRPLPETPISNFMALPSDDGRAMPWWSIQSGSRRSPISSPTCRTATRCGSANASRSPVRTR